MILAFQTVSAKKLINYLIILDGKILHYYNIYQLKLKGVYMKQVLQHETYGEIVYEESFWSGKKTLSFNNVELKKLSNKSFLLEDGREITVNGNYLTGVKLLIGSETIKVTPTVTWYEIVLSVLPFLLIMVWGNVVALCEIVPVVGGAIGGFISGLLSVTNLLIIRRLKNIWLKIAVSIAMLGLTFGICCGIGYAIVSMIQ